MKYIKTISLAALLAVSGVVSGCGDKKAATDTQASQAPVPVIDQVIAGDWRSDSQKARDQFRHPKETLEFFGLGPNMSVLEVFPGSGGWYTAILAPYLAQTGGTYTANIFEESLGERFRNANDKFMAKFADTQTFGVVNTVELGPTSPPPPADTYDVILSFRNVHNWMSRGYADKVFADFYIGLKPGGILGIVEHRLPESREQDPKAGSGYVQVSYTKALAKAAGFEFVGSSEVNANPKDTADHPYGVWTLPPVSRKPKPDDPAAKDFDEQKYLDIGESDRYTLKFRKPL